MMETAVCRTSYRLLSKMRRKPGAALFSGAEKPCAVRAGLGILDTMNERRTRWSRLKSDLGYRLKIGRVFRAYPVVTPTHYR